MNHIFQVGDTVRVRNGSPPGHIRTPFYVRSCLGVIERVSGGCRNTEELAFGRFNAHIVPLYRVRFKQQDVWPDYRGNPSDTLEVEIYEFWLKPITQ